MPGQPSSRKRLPEMSNEEYFMYHRWQPIHCDQCLEEQLAEELSQVSPGRKHACSHGAVELAVSDLIWSGFHPISEEPATYALTHVATASSGPR